MAIETLERLQFNSLPANINYEKSIDFKVVNAPLEEQVKISILRDLLNLNWEIKFNAGKIEVIPPSFYNKETIRQSMAIKRNEIIHKNREWIGKHIDLARENLADGYSVLKSEIIPSIHICRTEKEHSLFRIFRYYWSSPYSEYVGRRIKLIIRDEGLPGQPVIGIIALGSPIIHIPERDNFIGWDKEKRTKNLIYTMDAYVIGALPPYNYLLGGKLLSYLVASNEIRKIYQEKYLGQETIISKRKASDLVGIFTTGLFGKSSQYNRLKFDGELLFKLIGETKGYGTLHLTEKTIGLMKELLLEKKIIIGNNFGEGPSWRMRLIRTVGDILQFDSDFLLKHSFRRPIYYVPLAKNSIKFLNGEEEKPEYYDWPIQDLVNFWKERWLSNRKKKPTVINQIVNFKPGSFEIT